jgi:L-alanine-DL-glutamate epimerase-like enolase superfamily enzyme
MKVARVRWAPYRIPFRAQYKTSLGTLTQREGLVLEVETDDGRIGLGEAAPAPEALGTSKALDRAIGVVAPSLIGCELVEVEPSKLAVGWAPEITGAVRAALDIALFQLFPQARHMPLARFLRTNASDSVAVNALVTLSSDPRRAAAAAVAEGFSTIKLKVGAFARGQSSERGVQPGALQPGAFLPASVHTGYVADVRAAIGPDLKLRLDPNGAWTVEEAAGNISAVSGYDIEYLEQPIPPGDLDALARLQAAVDVDIAADEDVTDLETARRIIEMSAARVLVLKPQRLGGFRPCLQVMEEASRAGVRCVVTTSIEAGVGTAACLHLAAALPPGSPASGLATADLLASELTTPHLAIENGVMRVPTEPGLGVTLDAKAAAPFLGEWREAP